MTEGDGDFVFKQAVWTDADFASMNWHDCTVHGLALRPELFELWLDIDYIFQWVHPGGDDKFFKFWVAPATLVFANLYNLKFDLDANLEGRLSLQSLFRDCASVPRNNPQGTEWSWLLDFLGGEITFRSSGYSQFTRRFPVLGGQELPFEKRGGISFGRDLVDSNEKFLTAG